MQRMYEFFGLREDPFRLNPDPGFFYPSVIHKQALFSLEYIVKQREGFCVITGEPGTGKTTIINVFRKRLPDTARIAVILTPRLGPDEFLHAVFNCFGISSSSDSKNERLNAFREFLVTARNENRHVIILVDEAQNVPETTLEELRLLSNLETDTEKLLQIILIGQPELHARLKQPRLRQLNQRITERVLLRPLTLHETVEYVNFRLMQAGKNSIALSRALVRPVHRFSGGIPRIVNLVLSRAVMAAYIEESAAITPRHMRYALRHVRSTHRYRSDRAGSRGPIWRLAAGAACMLAAGVLACHLLVRDTLLVPSTQTNREEAPVQTSQAPASPVAPSPAPATAAPPPAPRDSASEKMQLTVVPHTARVRAAPRLDALTIGFVNSGLTIESTAEATDAEGKIWYRVIETTNGHGWISSSVVRVEP